MKVLFIGNSHTFCNGLPFQVRELLRQTRPDSETVMCATGGMTLGWHSQQPETQMAIQFYEWDYIVLQEKTHPFDGYDVLLNDCMSLLPYLQKTGAQILLYMTWAEKRFPANQAILDKAFTAVAKELRATLVPVSKAWQQLLRSAPEIELYDMDGEHANPTGSYLAACVFYSILEKHSPVGLPHKICVNGDELVNISQSDAEKIQQAAWAASQDSAA